MADYASLIRPTRFVAPPPLFFLLVRLRGSAIFGLRHPATKAFSCSRCKLSIRRCVERRRAAGGRGCGEVWRQQARYCSAISPESANLGSARSPTSICSIKGSGSRSRFGWNHCMIQTASRTTVGANKSKDVTIDIHSGLVLEAKGRLLAGPPCRHRCLIHSTWPQRR